MIRLQCHATPMVILAALLVAPAPAAAGERAPYDLIGGDDLQIGFAESLGAPSLDIADNGYIFAAVDRNDSASGFEILVYRSTDDGESFSLWGELSDPAAGEGFHQPCLDVVEGLVDAVFVAYRRSRTGTYSDICMTKSPITGSSAVWGPEVTAMSQSGIYFNRPRFHSDVSSHSNYYLYLVAEGNDDTGIDIWFTRSTDHGGSFETPYMLATLGVDDRKYWYPDIAHGFGGHLHVTWYFSSDDGSFDDSIRYRRASNYADAGLADWDYWVSLTTTTDGYDDESPRIEAGATSNEVVIAYRRNVHNSSFSDMSMLVSHDAGASFEGAWHWADGPFLIGDVEEQPDTGIWMMLGLDENDPCLYTAHVSNLTSWSGPASFQDEAMPAVTVQFPDLALNPADDYRPAALWVYNGETHDDPQRLFFDADWMNDPGRPNYDPGFPITVPASWCTAPALVDLDHDGDLEIVFVGLPSTIHAYHHDGTPAAGWPVNVGAILSDGPVAVGDLNGDGYPLVVVGTADGEAYAYDHQGNLMPGWPTTIGGPEQAVYVSIGALGPPHLRTVVCVSSNRVRFRNRSGVTPTGAVGWNFGPGYAFVAPAAVGDIDLDGIAEVVGAYNTAVFACEMLSTTLDFVVNVGHAAYDAPTLGDLDLDGDLEILVPSEDGILTVLDHTGVSVGGGFPWDSGDGAALSSAALANLRATAEPEIAFNTSTEQTHVLYQTGAPLSGFPITLNSVIWPQHNSPAIDRLNGSASDLVVSMTHILGAWDNFAAVIDGWPVGGSFPFHPGPAVGDIDLDGRNEVVALAGAMLHVIDVNSPPNIPSQSWPMVAHDPQRTGCSDCPEDLTPSDVSERDGERITHVSFSAPSPNPLVGITQFNYAVPTRAVVSLEVFDPQGVRVATILRDEVGPGRRVLYWNGCDDQDLPLASGQYFARLQVRGPGGGEDLVRRLTILR